METLNVYKLDGSKIETKIFNDETEARVYFHEKYGKDKDEFGNLGYYFTLN